LLRNDARFVIWWGTRVECENSLARVDRDGRLRGERRRAARSFLDALYASAHEIEPSEGVRAGALRLVGLHTLRAADAFQLAAALVWTKERTSGVSFVCLDTRLREAALRERFKVLPYLDEVNEIED
jgi:predicted nucleic acid-binding protein